MSALISKMDFALNAADRGFMPFPMGPDSDEPAFPQGDAIATKNKTQLRAWWDEDPRCNVGIALENLLTLRITQRCRPETLAQLALLLKEHDAPKSVRTQRAIPGHRIEICMHFLLPVGATVEAKSDVLFAGIDVLSNDDFVVGPGSILDGKMCAFVDDKSLSQASPWLLEVCGVQLVEGEKAMTMAATQIKTSLPAVVSKKAAALKAASRGFSVFPIRPYVHPGKNATPEQFEAAAKAAKAPLVANWQNLATQDPRQINEWWDEWPDANIATTTENFIVVDIDPRNGGKSTFAMLMLVQDFPDTAVSNTQGGGHHRFYALPPHTHVKGGTNKLGSGVDIKSRGGYVLLPGSTIEGRAYVWGDERPIALAPQWLIDRCKAAKPKTDAAGKRLVEEDDTAIELATQWMLTRAPTAEYGAIDDTTYKVAARLYDFGVSVETATDIMLEWNELKCDPPGGIERLVVVTESASHNRENAIGSSHPLAPNGFEVHEIAERPAPQPVAPASTGLATPLLQFDPVGLELRPWVIPGFACRGRVTLLAGPGGVAKSTYYLMVAIATVSGRGDICGFPILKRERVWVWNQEDDIAEMQRRVAAIMKAFGVSWDDLKDEDGSPMLFLDSGVDKPLMLANRSAEHSIMPGKQVVDVIASAKANKIAVIILDPLVEFHEASENDNVQMRAVVGQVRRIAVEADCAAMLSTHTRKPPVASSDGFAGEMDAARGASAQLGVVRIGATIFSMSPKQAKEYRLAEGTTHLDYVRIDIAKNNLAPVLPAPAKVRWRVLRPETHSAFVGR